MPSFLLSCTKVNSKQLLWRKKCTPTDKLYLAKMSEYHTGWFWIWKCCWNLLTWLTIGVCLDVSKVPPWCVIGVLLGLVLILSCFRNEYSIRKSPPLPCVYTLCWLNYDLCNVGCEPWPLVGKPWPGSITLLVHFVGWWVQLLLWMNCRLPSPVNNQIPLDVLVLEVLNC